MPYRIVLEKESFKFSCSHFTVFSDDRAERLHGHNYYVAVEIEVNEIDTSQGFAFDFNEIKPLVREITDQLDEFVLLPAQSPYVTLELTGDSVRVLFSSKRYELPKRDVRILPVVNVTTEELARYISVELRKRLPMLKDLKCLSVGVRETRGQGVYYAWSPQSESSAKSQAE